VLSLADLTWKKVMKSDPWYHMFILLIKKKYESLCLELLQFVLLILITALPFIFTQPLVIYWYMSNLPDSTHHLRVITFKPLPYLRETGQNAPTFFRLTIILPKWHVWDSYIFFNQENKHVISWITFHYFLSINVRFGQFTFGPVNMYSGQ
jgi:hypothetical protein